MNWLDEIDNRVVTSRPINREDMVVLRLSEVRRLVSEARKMERIRRQMESRTERDEYDGEEVTDIEVIDDIKRIIGEDM